MLLQKTNPLQAKRFKRVVIGIAITLFSGGLFFILISLKFDEAALELGLTLYWNSISVCFMVWYMIALLVLIRPLNQLNAATEGLAEQKRSVKLQFILF